MRTDTHILTNTPAAEIFTFSSKERDAETGLSYFGARYYSSELSIWLSVDPMSDKYPSLSPYTYCANNPVKLVDPNGEEVHPVGEEEYKMILNTLPLEDRAYVQLDKNGYINKELMNSHDSESGNYNGLCDLVNDDVTYDVILDDAGFPYVDQKGSLKSQHPEYQESSPVLIDKDFKYLSGNTTGEGGVSHEGFGHALLYCLNGHNAYNAGHYSQPGQKDANTQLADMIKSARKETYKNMMHQ